MSGNNGSKRPYPPRYRDSTWYGETSSGFHSGINDALVLLKAVWEHRHHPDYWEGQTQEKLSEWTGGTISQQRVSRLLNPEQDETYYRRRGSLTDFLSVTAEKYGYRFVAPRKRGFLIDVYDRRPIGEYEE